MHDFPLATEQILIHIEAMVLLLQYYYCQLAVLLYCYLWLVCSPYCLDGSKALNEYHLLDLQSKERYKT